MKQVLTRGIKLSLLVALVVSVSLMANYFLLAWIAPTANPPADNITIEGVPPDSVIAFYRADCPAGWKAADGTDLTPDLRGQFIRGINDFGSAAGARADGNEDPDGLRVLGNLQQDELEQHRHDGTLRTTITLGPGTHQRRVSGDYTGYYGGAETRPRNVALIYCVKE